MQAGAMKYGQQQQFAKDVGEISGLNAATPYGYRTTDIAPIVRKKYSDRINEFQTRFATSYDSPQAVMELTKLRTEFQSDPDRQLMIMDATQGNEERNAQIRSTNTYNMDYDPNVHPATGKIKQFRPGEPYSPYGQLIHYQDLEKHANEAFNQVQPNLTSVPLLNESGESIGQQTRKYIDPNKLEPVIQSLAQKAVEGNSKEAAYLRTRFRDENGNPRNPTFEEAYNYYKPLGEKYMQESRTLDIYKTSTGSGNGSGGEQGVGIATQTMPASKTSVNMTDLTKRKVNQKLLYNFFHENKIPLSSDAGFANIIARLKNEKALSDKATSSEEATALKKYIDETKDQSMYLKVERPTDPKEVKDAESYFFGSGAVNGKLNSDIKGSVIAGSYLWDTKTGETIIDKKKISELLKEDTSIAVIGKVDERTSTMAPFPNAWQIDIGDKSYLIKGSDEGTYKDKLTWNLYGMDRSNTDIGAPFAYNIIDGRGEITDISDPGMDGDPTKLTDSYALYIVPMRDHTETDKYNRPIIKYKVFSSNPLVGNNNKSNYMDDSNPKFLREYKLSDFADMTSLVTKMFSIEDVDDMMTMKFSK